MDRTAVVEGLQKTMNWRRELFRLWIVGGAVLWVIFVTTLAVIEHRYPPMAPVGIAETAGVVIGLPLAALILGSALVWVFRRLRRRVWRYVAKRVSRGPGAPISLNL